MQVDNFTILATDAITKRAKRQHMRPKRLIEEPAVVAPKRIVMKPFVQQIQTTTDSHDDYRMKATDAMKATAHNISRIMARNNITQKQVGIRSGIDFRKINRFVNFTMPVASWYKIENVVRKTVDDIIEERAANVKFWANWRQQLVSATAQSTVQCKDMKQDVTNGKIINRVYASIDIYGTGAEYDLAIPIEQFKGADGVYNTIYSYADTAPNGNICEFRMIESGYIARTLTPLGTIAMEVDDDDNVDADLPIGLKLEF